MWKTANEAYAIHIGCMAGIDWNGCTIKFNIVVCSAIRGCPWLAICIYRPLLLLCVIH